MPLISDLCFSFVQVCACACFCKQADICHRKGKTLNRSFLSYRTLTVVGIDRPCASKASPLVSVCLFVAHTVGKDLSDMREEAVCSGTYISLTTSSLHINADGQQRMEWTKGIIY